MQNVVAVDGFAYGAVNADIHVFGSDQPVYLLADWRPEPGADPGLPRDVPGPELGEWRDSPPRLAVRWMYGPEGQRKLRLAAGFARESAAVGWKVIAAFHGPDFHDPGAVRPEEGSHDMPLVGAAGLLILVDDADRWLAPNLTWLFKNRMLHKPEVRARVLMLARTADAWPAVRGMLDTYQPAMSSLFLPSLSAAGQQVGPS